MQLRMLTNWRMKFRLLFAVLMIYAPLFFGICVQVFHS